MYEDESQMTEGLAEGIAQLVRQGFDAGLIVERIDQAANALGLPVSHPACQAFRETARAMTMEATEPCQPGWVA